MKSGATCTLSPQEKEFAPWLPGRETFSFFSMSVNRKNKCFLRLNKMPCFQNNFFSSNNISIL